LPEGAGPGWRRRRGGAWLLGVLRNLFLEFCRSRRSGLARLDPQSLETFEQH
jgi:DNA-directed RNA polymerase specialized sigma24 family protein